MAGASVVAWYNPTKGGALVAGAITGWGVPLARGGIKLEGGPRMRVLLDKGDGTTLAGPARGHALLSTGSGTSFVESTRGQALLGAEGATGGNCRGGRGAASRGASTGRERRPRLCRRAFMGGASRGWARGRRLYSSGMEA